MDERELLEAIGQMMDTKLDAKLAPITDRLDRLEQGQAELAPIADRMGKVEDRIESLTKNVANLNHSIEPQLKVIQEGITGILEKYDRLEKLERTVEDQGHRIWALEQERKAQ